MKKQKKKEQVNVGLMSFVKFVAFILPLCLYLLCILWLFPVPNSGFITLGVVGSILVGLSLVNVVGLLDKMYLGSVVTVAVALPGALLLAASSFVLYNPTVYSKFNEEEVTFYFLSWSIIAVSLVYYLFFRHAVGLYLQGSGMSKTKIKKSLKGARNFWWYDSLKNEAEHKWMFYVNKLFTLLYPVAIMVQLFLGWWRATFFAVTIINCLLMALNLAMGWLMFTTWGKAHSEHRRTPLIHLIGVFIFPVAACVGIISYFIRMLK